MYMFQYTIWICMSHKCHLERDSLERKKIFVLHFHHFRQTMQQQYMRDMRKEYYWMRGASPQGRVGVCTRVCNRRLSRIKMHLFPCIKYYKNLMLEYVDTLYQKKGTWKMIVLHD